MSNRQAHLRRARHWIANRGCRGFFQELLRRTRLKLRGQPLPGRLGPETGPHPFDTAYNVDTTGLVWGESLTGDSTTAIDKQAQYWATGYYGVAPSAFEIALDRLALDWPRFTFVDIGCGKGRALLLSLRYPFREAIGVELSPALAAVAQHNLIAFNAPWRQGSVPVKVITGDATGFTMPGGPLVLFLYHPFAAPVMRRFLDHLLGAARTERREIYLLYTNPELAPMLDKTPGLTRLWGEWSMLTPSETAADRFGSIDEHTIAYQVAPPS